MNERQYDVTRSQLRKLESVLALSKEAGKGKMDPQIYRAMIAGIESQMAELQQDLRKYVELTKGKRLRLPSVNDLGTLIIKGRIARRLTQEALARRIGVATQQIQRYEATGYRSAGLARILSIMKALDLDFQATVTLDSKKQECSTRD